jgi:hypothetical protein
MMGKEYKVGILYICTGKYISFLEDFLLSSNEFLLPFSKKKYFIFTDNEFKSTGDSSINIIPQLKLGYDNTTNTSYDSLMRYHIFLKHKDLFKDLDYLVFFNANTIFIDYILEKDFLPNNENDGLMSVHHSGHYIMGDKWNGYDKTTTSVSYIPPKKRNKKYCQGCLIGGKVSDFLTLSEEVSKMIDIDLANIQYTSAWDEPYMNKYLLNTNVRVLHPGYAYPEVFGDRLRAIQNKITQLDKSKYVSYADLRP